MKSFLTLILFVSSSLVYSELPSEIKNLMGKDGNFTAYYNGEIANQTGGICYLENNPFSEPEDESIRLNSIAYTKKIAHLKGVKSVQKDGYTEMVITGGTSRPGGSTMCGNSATRNYKMTIKTYKNKIIIEEVYKCGRWWFSKLNNSTHICEDMK